MSVKSPMRVSSFLLSVIFMISCQKNDLPNSGCAWGMYIGNEMCSNIPLIQVDSTYPIGRDITFYNGVKFKNVIKLLDHRVPTIKSSFYYREFEHNRDSYLIKSPIVCPALYSYLDVPLLVGSSNPSYCN